MATGRVRVAVRYIARRLRVQNQYSRGQAMAGESNEGWGCGLGMLGRLGAMANLVQDF